MTEVFMEVVSLAERLGVRDINELPGAWEYQVDKSWRIAVNGHKDAVHVAPGDCMEVDLQPFEMAAWFNGWLAGLMSPCDGVIAAGLVGNERALIKALRKAG